MDYENVFLMAGQYDDLSTAEADFEQLKQARKQGMVGAYQAAVFEKRADGKVKVLNTTSTSRGTGAKWGAAIGAAIGLVFPPAILATTAEGAALGALGGNLSKGWFRGDVKRVAETLEPGQAGVIAIAEAGPTLDAAIVLAQAQRVEHEQVTGEDAEKIHEHLRSEEQVTV